MRRNIKGMIASHKRLFKILGLDEVTPQTIKSFANSISSQHRVMESAGIMGSHYMKILIAELVKEYELRSADGSLMTVEEIYKLSKR